MRRVVLLLLVALLLLGGCADEVPEVTDPNGRSTSTLPDSSPPTASPGTPSTTGAANTPGATLDTNFSTPGDERFCGLARSYIEQFSQRAGPGETRAFGEALQEAQSIVLEMETVAPPEIVVDIVNLTGVLAVVVPALEAADFDLSQVPPEALLALQDPDFQASAARLQAYTETACEAV